MEFCLREINTQVDLNDSKGQVAVRLIAEITVNWGIIEYQLYRILEAATPIEWRTLAADFFASRGSKRKRDSVIKAVSELFSDDLKIQRLVESAMQDLKNLCGQRDLIAHGIWSGANGIYVVQQLRWDKDTKDLIEPIRITLDELSNIAKATEFMRQRLATIGTEVLAGWWLKRYSLRSARAAASPNIRAVS